MKVKCPHCDYKGEALDGKCPVCDFPLEVKSSLLMKFRSMNIATKAVTVFFLLFVAILIISSIISLMSNHKKEIYMHTKTIQSSGTIDGFLSVNWGDSIEVAAQKLSSSGYEIKDIDYIKKNIRLKPIILAGHKTSESEVGVLCFYSKGFYSGWVVFTPDSTNIEKAKEEIAYVIGQKYGHPSSKDSLPVISLEL